MVMQKESLYMYVYIYIYCRYACTRSTHSVYISSITFIHDVSAVLFSPTWWRWFWIRLQHCQAILFANPCEHNPRIPIPGTNNQSLMSFMYTLAQGWMGMEYLHFSCKSYAWTGCLIRRVIKFDQNPLQERFVCPSSTRSFLGVFYWGGVLQNITFIPSDVSPSKSFLCSGCLRISMLNKKDPTFLLSIRRNGGS